MLKSKKTVIIVAVVVALVLVGSITGVAFAQTGSPSTDPGKTLLGRVAKIMGVDQQKLESAFTQARKELRDERLQDLVTQGKITQEQLNQYKKWLDSRPDMEPYQGQLKNWQQTRPPIPPELKKWQESRPNIPMPGPRGSGFFPGTGPK